MSWSLSPSASAGNSFVFGSTGYTTWASLDAAMAALPAGLPKNVYLTSDLTLPAAPTDLRRAQFYGEGNFGNTSARRLITVPEGCTLTNLGYRFLNDGVTLHSTATATVPVTVTLASNFGVTLENDASICCNALEFIRITGTSGTGRFFM